MEHFNIQIKVQRVIQPEPVPAGGSAYGNRMTENTTVKPERQITDVLSLAITADDEGEAYAKARKMLEAATPEWAMGDAASADIAS